MHNNFTTKLHDNSMYEQYCLMAEVWFNNCVYYKILCKFCLEGYTTLGRHQFCKIKFL